MTVRTDLMDQLSRPMEQPSVTAAAGDAQDVEQAVPDWIPDELVADFERAIVGAVAAARKATIANLHRHTHHRSSLAVNPATVTAVGRRLLEFAPPATQPRDWHGRWLAKGSPGGAPMPEIQADRTPAAEARDAMIEALKPDDGGFTIDPRDGSTPDHGFAVAIRGHSSITPQDEFFKPDVGPRVIEQWLNDNAEFFRDNPNAMVGGWHDPKNHEIVLDPSLVIEDRAEAIKLGVEQNQQAIADLAAIHQGDWDNAFIDTHGTGDREKLAATVRLEPHGRAPHHAPRDRGPPEAGGGDDARGAAGLREGRVRQDRGYAQAAADQRADSAHVGEFAPPATQPRDWHGRWLAKGGPGAGVTSAPEVQPLTEEDVYRGSLNHAIYDLDPGETAALASYIKGDSSTINMVLNGRAKGLAESVHRDALRKTQTMDRGLAKFTLPRDTVVYRGVSGDDPLVAGEVGKTVTNPGYVSTSRAREYAQHRADTVPGREHLGDNGWLMELQVPAGTHAVPIEALAQTEGFGRAQQQMARDEKEVLLPRGTTWHVVGRNEADHSIQLELVPTENAVAAPPAVAATIGEFAPPPSQPRDWHGRWLSKAAIAPAGGELVGDAARAQFLEGPEIPHSHIYSDAEMADARAAWQGGGQDGTTAFMIQNRVRGRSAGEGIFYTADEAAGMPKYAIDDVNAQADPYIGPLDASMKPIKHPIEAWRVTNMNAVNPHGREGDDPAAVVGKSFGERAFAASALTERETSFVYEGQVRDGMDPVKLRMHVQPGVRATYYRQGIPVGTSSGRVDVYELLIQRGAQFTVTGYDRDTDTLDVTVSNPAIALVSAVSEFAPPPGQPRDWHGKWLAKGSAGGGGPIEVAPSGPTNRDAWNAIMDDEAKSLDDPKAAHPENYEPNKGFGVHLKTGATEVETSELTDNNGPPRIYDRKALPPGTSVDDAAKQGKILNVLPPLEIKVNERPPAHVYRVMDVKEYDQAKARGYIQSKGDMNLGQEGTVTSLYSTGAFYTPLDGSDYRIVRISYDDADGWRHDPADGYVKTDAQVPFARVDAVTPVMKTERALSASAALVAAPAGPINPDIFDEAAWRRAIAAEGGPVIERAVRTGARQATIGYGFNVTDPGMARAVREHVATIQDWSTELRRSVSDFVSEGIGEGWSVDTTAAKLVSEPGSPLSTARARTIARTELIAGANAGVYRGAQAIGAKRKQWLSTHDARTRPTHVEADEQVVPIDQPFYVGGASFDYPGDPHAPVQERVNCRCTMLFLDADEPAPLKADERAYIWPEDVTRTGRTSWRTADDGTPLDVLGTDDPDRATRYFDTVARARRSLPLPGADRHGVSIKITPPPKTGLVDGVVAWINPEEVLARKYTIYVNGEMVGGQPVSGSQFFSALARTEEVDILGIIHQYELMVEVASGRLGTEEPFTAAPTTGLEWLAAASNLSEYGAMTFIEWVLSRGATPFVDVLGEAKVLGLAEA